MVITFISIFINYENIKFSDCYSYWMAILGNNNFK